MTNITKILIFFSVATFALVAFVFLPVNKIDTGMAINVASAFDGGGSGGSTGGSSYGGSYGGDSGCCGGSGSYDTSGYSSPAPSPSPTPSTPPPKKPGKCDKFTASASSVAYGGGKVKLTWNTTNADSVSINNGVGGVADDGSKTVKVTKNTTFTLTAKGAGGNDSCKVTIKVKPPVVAKCDSLTANRNTVPYNGGNVTLTWKTTNTSSVSITDIGSVNADDSTTVFVNSNKTFTLTAKGTDGNDTCTVTIKTEPKEEEKFARCVSFTANKDEVDEDGETVKLEWETENATSVEISGVGNVAKNGSVSVFVNDDETITLTAKGTDNSDTCKVEIETEEDDEDDEPRPRCELDISKNHVNKGDRVTLSWETDDADDIRIRDNHGNTIFDTDDYRSSERDEYYDGEIDIIINEDTEFTMTARGDGGSRSCEVDVETDDDFAVYEKRDQGYVIALTQVPYTGFEAGTFLTFLFYAVLTLWALFIAYILVIKKGSVLGFSLYAKNAGFSEADVANRKKVEALVAKYSSQNNWK